jgi:hypothetical protein
LKTYRLAVACTGEYAQAPGIAAGANAALLHAAIVTTVNRVVGVYEIEVAVRMVLVANNNIVEYLVAATDPFTGNDDANTLIDESQTVINANIGAANYDIGHTFSTGGGGLAGLGVVCNNSQKASGITGSGSPTGDGYDIDYVAHEMGHQFDGNHTMAHCGGVPANTRFEPGSGTTIQAYAGICGGQDIQPHSDPTFHAISFDEISDFLAGSGGSCGVATPTGNTLPVIAPLPNNGLSIPVGTPFTLTATATDADGDALSYCWEGWDLGGTSTSWNSGATGAVGNTWPLFKSRVPKANGNRTFPDSTVILAGFPANPPAVMNGLKGETLSPVARPMKFRLTVRDNRAAGGGVVSSGNGCQTTTVFQINTSGTTPFIVTVPNGGESYAGGSSQTITWNVSGTNAAPVSVANVKISLSTNAGLTYPTVITASTANDGTESLVIPSIATTTARIKVEAIGNIFFDISNANFTITAAASGYTFNSVAPATITCGVQTTGSITLATTATGGFSTPINLVATGNPAGTTVSFSPTPLTPGNSSVVTLNNTNTLAPGTYNVTVTGTAGATIQTSVLSFTVLPGTAPGITTQPTGVAVCAGANAAFNVVSPGGGLSYQWQVSTDGGGTFTNIAGATTASYTATAVTSTQDNNQYHVIVSTLCGTTTSNAAILTVNSAAAIATQPIAAVICSGNDITFTVGATGTAPLTYQWQSSTNGCAGPFANIPGATSSSHTITGVTVALDNTAYQVIVSGTCTPISVTSNCALLSVSSSVNIITQPTNTTVCDGSDATFTTAGSGSGILYQWQVSTDGGATYTNIAGATNPTYTVTGTPAIDGNLYQAILSNATCATPSVSAAATLTVNTLPDITTQPTSVTLCAGGNAVFTSAANGTAVTYQWQVSTDGGTTFTDIPGETAATLTLNAVTAGLNNNEYHVVASGTCTPPAASNNATLTVISNVTVTTPPAAVAACAGSDANFTVVGNGGGAPSVNYQWQVSTDGGTTYTDIAGATSATLTLSAVTAGMNNNLYQVIMSSATCPTPVTSTGAALTVNALPVVTASADVLSVCTGSPATLTATGATDYSWEPGTLSGDVVVVNPTVDPGNPGVPNPIDYVVTGTDANGCSSTATVTVTASPLPVVSLTADPANTKLVPGRTITLTASVTPAGGFTLTWFKDDVVIPGLTGNTFVAAVGDEGTYYVTAADASGLCSNQSESVVIADSITTHFYIYPNPNNGNFTVSYYNFAGLTRGQTVTVYDSKGARVYSKTFIINRYYQLLNINLGAVNSGTYIVVLTNASNEILGTERIIVGH